MNEEQTQRDQGAESDVLARAAYEAGLAALKDQRAELSEIRDRAFKLLALAGTVLSFLAATVLRDPPDQRSGIFYGLMGLGTAAFALLVVCSSVALWPVKEWWGRVQPQTIVDHYRDFSSVEAFRWLSTYTDDSLVKNDEALAPRRRATEIAAACLGVEVVAVVLAAWVFV